MSEHILIIEDDLDIANIERDYLMDDVLRLGKAKNDKNRDVRWAWEADEAKQLDRKSVV